MSAPTTPPPPPAKPVGTVLDWKCGLCGGTMEVSHVHFLVHCNVPFGTGGSVSTPRWLYESKCQGCGAGNGYK